jgi:DNA invertase Pin-like site-specific DNA recombinase
MPKTSKPRRVALYARVSTDHQSTKNQLAQLHAVAERHGWQVVAEFVDRGISGAKGRDQRPQFDKMLRGVALKEFDMVAAWSVDRLGRSLQDLVGTMELLREKSVDLFLHQQALDTSTASGRAMFAMLGVFAEFERALIVERVKAGMQRARAAGKRIGRPTVDEKVAAKVRELRAQGVGIVKTAATLGIGVSVVQRLDTKAAFP